MGTMPFIPGKARRCERRAPLGFDRRCWRTRGNMVEGCLNAHAGTREVVRAACAFGSGFAIPLGVLEGLGTLGAGGVGHLQHAALAAVGWAPLLWTYGFSCLLYAAGPSQSGALPPRPPAPPASSPGTWGLRSDIQCDVWELPCGIQCDIWELPCGQPVWNVRTPCGIHCQGWGLSTECNTSFAICMYAISCHRFFGSFLPFLQTGWHPGCHLALTMWHPV